MNPNLPPLPETPYDSLGAIVREKVIVDDQTFVIDHPGDSDRLLTNPVIKSAFAADEYLPYWADLWPVSRILAKVILREPWPEPKPEAIEIGCGLGLPGIAALARGLRVTFTDYDATALRFAADNARANGFENFRTLQFDWRAPPADLCAPVILVSDLLYELRSVAPVVAMIKQIMLPGGVCLLTDQDRVPSHTLREMLPTAGMTYTTQAMKAGEPGGRRVRGTLYRITHAT
ncbi:MAG: class I SAM-dependent methyltransferase [Gemmataceae bacterium]|nr:class I SAM-dependent methyltransferase [Gemmataceae bacterium]